MHLFQLGSFKLHSGQESDFKIDCDALTDADIATCAYLIAGMAGQFSDAVGIPTGGHRLARALRRYIIPGNKTIYVDDVWTTGASMNNYRLPEDEGYVIFARGKLDANVRALFTMNEGKA